jgi:hypothetical protein
MSVKKKGIKIFFLISQNDEIFRYDFLAITPRFAKFYDKQILTEDKFVEGIFKKN